MYRSMCVMMAIAAAGLFVSSLPAQQSGLKLGEKLEGELTEMGSYVGWPGFVDRYYGYATDITVSLKAGQSISISATVVGQGRKVSVALQDPTGKIIAATQRNTAIKTVQLTVGEVPATGKYKIAVISDQIGAYSLRATGPSGEDTIEALEARISQLRKELAAAEAKLKALKENSRGRLNSPIEK